MKADDHIWRTEDGRLVRTGDPDAAFLAYAPGDEMDVVVPPKPATVYLGTPPQEPVAPEEEPAKPAPKKRVRPADKSRTPSADK